MSRRTIPEQSARGVGGTEVRSTASRKVYATHRLAVTAGRALPCCGGVASGVHSGGLGVPVAGDVTTCECGVVLEWWVDCRGILGLRLLAWDVALDEATIAELRALDAARARQQRPAAIQ